MGSGERVVDGAGGPRVREHGGEARAVERAVEREAVGLGRRAKGSRQARGVSRPSRRTHDPLAGFVKYTSASGKFELMMPTVAKEEDTPAPTAAGPMTLHMASSMSKDGAWFAQYADVAGQKLTSTAR